MAESISAFHLKHCSKVNHSLREKKYSHLSEFLQLSWLVPQTQVRPRILPKILFYSSSLFYGEVFPLQLKRVLLEAESSSTLPQAP